IAWLSVLVARRCSRLNRDPRNDPARTARLPDEEPRCCEGDAAVAIERRDLAAALGDALMRLPRADRLLFLLAAEGATSPELAAQFSTTSDAVRSRLKRARRLLRDHVTRTQPEAALPPAVPHRPRGGTLERPVAIARRHHL